MSKRNKKRKARFYNARITSTITTTLVLLLIGLTLLTPLVADGLTNYVKENISFNVILENNITEKQISDTKHKLEKYPFVKSSTYISKEEAKKQLIEELGEDPEKIIGYNPASDCIEVFIHSSYLNSDSLTKVSNIIKGHSNVKDLLYRQDALQLVNANLNKAFSILLILSLMLLLIAFTVVRNTVRLSIYSKRFLINTMKLVGAKDGFIRRPFIRSYITEGIISGLLADGILFGILAYLSKEFTGWHEIISPIHIVALMCSVIILGVLITAFSSWFAVNRYLKMKSGDMFYI